MKESERVLETAKALDAQLASESVRFYTCNQLLTISETLAEEYEILFGLTNAYCNITLWAWTPKERKEQRAWMLLMFAAVLEEEGR